VAADNLYPMPKAIEDAFTKAKVLLIEANPKALKADRIQALITAKGMYHGKEGLFDHLSPGTAERLKAYCERRKLSSQQLDRFKPWAVFSLIAALELKNLGYNLEKGLDHYFVDKATGTGKPIVELESLESQMEMFAGFDDEFQEMLLLSTLVEVKDFKAVTHELMTAWANGDLTKMNQIMLTDQVREEPRLKDLYVKMFDERNIKMVAMIEKYFKGKDPVFVIVGTGHIPGEQGILKLLEKRGFKAKQLKRGETETRS
jgi:uncharacterized protein YbaP (TraB family)